MRTGSSKEEDYLVPTSIHWAIDDVANWIEEIGFPQYRSCITSNLIDGRKLVIMDSSNLPRIGITDFDHILFITASIRSLLGIEDPFWNVSVADTSGSTMKMYLEKKSRTGPSLNKLKYSDFLKRC